jgi:flagellar basal-body rod protein FlgF
MAASGMRSRLQSMELLANNLANASSRGYKADREVYNLYSSADATDPNTGDVSQQPWINAGWVDFTQGTLQPTGNPLDVALAGKGFLAARGPNGILYTRNGTLRITPQGELVGPEDRAILDTKDQPVKLDPSKAINIDSTGAILQDGQPVAQLAIMEFPKPAGLVKFGESYFDSPDKTTNAPVISTSTEILQGRAEESNSGPAEAAVRLVSVLRQFEMLQKAVSIGSDMNKQAIAEIAKVAQ